MEKRFLFAIILSFLVLYIWAGIVQPPSPTPALNNTELIENKEFTEKSTSGEDQATESLDIAPEPEMLDEAIDDIQPEFSTLENNKQRVTFSNVGGYIKSVTLKEYGTSLPITKITSVKGYDNVKFMLVDLQDDSITYVFENLKYRITKSYHLTKNDYIIRSNTRIENKTNMSKLKKLLLTSYVISTSSLDNEHMNGIEKRDRGLYEYVLNSEKGIHRKNNAYKFSEKEEEDVQGEVHWIGFRDRYFSAIIKPEFPASGYSVEYLNDEKLKINVHSEGLQLPAKGGAELSTTIFYGPERWGILKQYDSGFEKIKKYYRFWLFDGIALFIDRLMSLFYRVIPNWGVCIIIMSTLIYFSMYPLTMRGMSSMRRLQELQPEMNRLRDKHKDNPQKMNQEMIEFYKKNKINPLGGCLPLLLQMPVFIGLYQVLWRSVAFKGANFLWIDDLSEPDRFIILPFKLPFIGNELNLLPILMMGIMFLQTKFQARNMTVTDPAQATQQKLMSTIMPVFLGVIFYKFASGLTLYFTMFYIFSTFTQWKISKRQKVGDERKKEA